MTLDDLMNIKIYFVIFYPSVHWLIFLVTMYGSPCNFRYSMRAWWRLRLCAKKFAGPFFNMLVYLSSSVGEYKFKELKSYISLNIYFDSKHLSRCCVRERVQRQVAYLCGVVCGRDMTVIKLYT